MFSGLFSSGRAGVFGVRAMAAAAVLLGASGQAVAGGDRDYRSGLVKPVIHMGGDRGGHGSHGSHGSHRSHGSHGHHGHGHGGSHSHNSFSLSIGSGFGHYGSGWSSGYRYSSGHGHYTPRYYAPAYCPPPVVVVRNDYIAPRPVYVDRPVYVERPVVVERPVERQVVVEKPVYVDRVVERTVEKPVYIETAPTAPAAGTYQDRELGDAYLRLGDFGNAVRVYSRYLTAWDKDGTAKRNLGFALVASGQPAEGFRSVVDGYRLEPELVNRPIRATDLGGAAGYSVLLDQATRSADQLNTADAWATVAILQHVNGARDNAVAALQKARGAGLDSTMLDMFTLAMSK